jgi:diguanylate cyclase (GGDEF)-like protein/PAS domain S-box-containing protein
MAKPTGTPPVEQQPQQQNQAPSQVARYLAADAPPVPLHYLTYLFEHVADVIFFLEVLGGDRYRFSAVNERFTLATGLPVSAVVGKEVDEIIPPDSLALVKSKYREAIATRNVVRWQEVSAYPTGTRTGDVTVSPVIDADGGCRLLMGVVHDITEHVQNRHQLELGSLVFQNSHEAIAVLDADGRVEAINPAFTAMRGYTLEEIAGKAPQVYNAGLDEADFDDALWARLRASGHWQGELWSRHKDGQVLAEFRSISAACGPDGQVRNYIEIGTDISDSKRAEELAWRQGNYDALTGLPNRQMFMERVAAAIRGGGGEAGSFTLLVIDLDRFKDVNETLGHSSGDEILTEAAQRLLDCTRDGDTVGRLGGDEFTVLLTARPEQTEAAFAVDRTAQAIIQAMARPFVIADEALHLSASIGITHYPKDAADMESLVKHADQAMYVAKQQGRNRYAYFSHAMQERAQARRRLIRDLRGAMKERRLEVHYQPIVDLATGALKKAESLVRWPHPQRGMIGPAEFIPLCEETGLIVELGEQVFETVVRDVVAWKADYGACLQVGINVSPVQLLSGREACERCFQLARRAALPEHTLVIEVTEGMLLDNNPFVIQQLRQVAENGMDLSLDDFGTGYSSLSYLKKFSFQFLKIDRAFVMHLEAGTTDYALCETIITMAHKLGMRVIAEGIETPEQLALLKQAGCDYGQGYLFSKAVPCETIARWLAGGAMPWMHAGFAEHAFKRTTGKLSE